MRTDRVEELVVVAQQLDAEPSGTVESCCGSPGDAASLPAVSAAVDRLPAAVGVGACESATEPASDASGQVVFAGASSGYMAGVGGGEMFRADECFVAPREPLVAESRPKPSNSKPSTR